MGARPAEFEPTNLKTPSLCACGRIAENSSLVKDRMGFAFFGFVFMYARHHVH